MKMFFLSILLMLTTSLWGQPHIKRFDDVWNQLYEKSLKHKAVELEKESNEESLKRANRHWLPRVYITGQWFSTNDPTQVFFNHLGQRSIEQSDFIPSDLNRPGRETFTAGSLGLDLPLYEGGLKTSQTSMYRALVKASEIEMKAKRSEEYSELARQYGSLLLLSQNEALLKELKVNLKKIISTYQVGAQSNPVGYSGLLGLKGVGNRIEGLLAQYEMKVLNARHWIDTKTENVDFWRPDTQEDINDYLTTKLSSASDSAYSSMILSQEMKLKTLDEMNNIEKARYLPRVGLFANNSMYGGDRDNENSQSYGLYLQWDLFNSDSFGRVGEAGAKALAEQAKLQAFKQEERIMLSQLQESKLTLEKTLKILAESDRLLQEQSSNAMKLFRSGMLNALQLAEVINRRVDLVENKLTAETQYLDVWSRLYQLNN
jgi:outer membrane protein TolC